MGSIGQATVDDNTASSEGDRSLLPIVTGQRDRFRQRNAELEEVSFCVFNITVNLVMPFVNILAYGN